MKKIITGIFLFTSLSAFTQNVTKEELEKEINPLNDKVTLLQAENAKLKNEIGTLQFKFSNANSKLESLQRQAGRNNEAIAETNRKLGLKISITETSASQKISAVDKSLSKNSLYGIIGMLSVILISGILYWLLSKRQKIDKTNFIEQLNKTKSFIEESLIKEFAKQTVLIESQIQPLEQQSIVIQSNPTAESNHSLALKVADEITLIERNIGFMDKNVKGLKQLLRSVQKLKDNLAANGYDVPELLGKYFHQGMNIVVINSVPDENLQKGEEIISKIIKPQVNHNNKMIQAGHVEVSVG